MATPAAILSLLVETKGATSAVAQLDKLEGAAKKTAVAADRTSTALATTGKTAKHHAEEAVAANVALTGSFTRMARAAVTAGAGFAAAYVGIAKAKEAISQTAELAHNTELLHRNTGLYIKTASGLQAVLKSRGVDAASVNMAFQTLGRNITAAETGTKRAQAAFMALGITMRDIKQAHGDLNVLLPKVADGFGQMKGGADRLAVSQALLGRGYRSLLPLFSQGAAGLQQQIDLADKYGATLSGKSLQQVMRLVQSQRELSLASTGLKIAFTQAAIPALLSLSHFAEKVARDFQGPGSLNEKLGRVGKDVGPALQKLQQLFVAAIPKIADRVGRDAPKVAAAFVRGFENSNALGQAALAAFVFKRFGVFTLVATRVGKLSGARFAESFIEGVFAGLIGWDIGTQLYKHVAGVRNAANAMAQVMTDALHPHIQINLNPLHPKFRIWFGNARVNDANANAKSDAQGLIGSLGKNPKGVIGNSQFGGLPGLAPIPKGMRGVPVGRTAAINAAASRYGISPALLLGVYGTETSYGANVKTSSAGAKGAFQFIKGTAKTYGYDYTNAQTPGIFRNQANAAAHYLSDLVRSHGGNVAAALSAYSGGGYSSVPGYTQALNQLNRKSSPKKVAGAGPQIEKMSLDSALAWIKKHFPGATAFVENPGTSNQHLHVQDINHHVTRAIAMALNKMGYAVGEYGGRPIPGVGGITTLKHKHYGAADHYHGGAIDVNSDGELIRAFGRGPVKPKVPVFRAPSIKQSDILGFLQAQLDHLDLLVQAGQVSQAVANAEKRSDIQHMLPFLKGDSRLQALATLRGLPKTPLTWTADAKRRLAMAIIQANPGNVANLPAGVLKAAGNSATLQNPWLQAFQTNLTNQVGAGAITQGQSDQALTAVLQKTLPFLTGQDQADVLTTLHTIAKNTLDTANQARASAISDAGFLGGLSGPAKDAVMGTLAAFGITSLPGGGNISEIGNPAAAGGLAQSDIATLMGEVQSGQAAFADVWPQILSDLQVIASGATESADASNAATVAVNALTDELKKNNDFAQSVTATELGQSLRAMADFVNGQIYGNYGQRSSTASAGSVARY